MMDEINVCVYDLFSKFMEEKEKQFKKENNQTSLCLGKCSNGKSCNQKILVDGLYCFQHKSQNLNPITSLVQKIQRKSPNNSVSKIKQEDKKCFGITAKGTNCNASKNFINGDIMLCHLHKDLFTNPEIRNNIKNYRNNIIITQNLQLPLTE